jgi:hypothetical protein
MIEPMVCSDTAVTLGPMGLGRKPAYDDSFCATASADELSIEGVLGVEHDVIPLDGASFVDSSKPSPALHHADEVPEAFSSKLRSFQAPWETNSVFKRARNLWIRGLGSSLRQAAATVQAAALSVK